MAPFPNPSMPQAWVQSLKAGAVYFAVVFGVGFVLGTFRTLWAVPLFGERTAELMESPIMLLVTILAARWVVRRLALPRSKQDYARLRKIGGVGPSLPAACSVLVGC